MSGLILILIGIFIIYLAFIIFQAVGGKLAGGKIEDLGLFLGPPILNFEAGGVNLKLNALPLGSYVRFRDDFQNLHPFRKIVVVLAGLATYLVLAFAGIGSSETPHQFATGFGQIFAGIRSPFAVGSKLIEALAKVFQEKSFLEGLGILAAKNLAFNLIPVGTLAGGNLIIYFLELLGIKSEKFNQGFQIFGLLFILAVTLTWIAAFVAALWRIL